MSRIAFIMVCHKNPDQVNCLIEKLTKFSDADVYIHVDKNHADLRDKIQEHNNVNLLREKDSFFIQWGSVNIVKATLSLIKAVKKSGKQYDYIWLVSGQDYPILPVTKIEERLTSRPAMNYIETIVPENRKYNRYRKLYEMAYPEWINKDTVFIKGIKRVYMLVTGGFSHTFSAFVRKRSFNFDFFFGSQWWTLTSDAAFEILDYSESHPKVLHYYEKCIIPDECYFQTLFMRGPYSNQREMNLTYINWGKNHRSPETLVKDDYDRLIIESSQFCFARKFDFLDENSKLLVEKLNRAWE